MLREIADSGVSVITVLHQPSERIFELLDDLVLMQSGERQFTCGILLGYFALKGEAAYVGPREGVLPFLASAGYDVPVNSTCCAKSSEYILDVLAGLEVCKRTQIPKPSTPSLIPWASRFLPLLQTRPWKIACPTPSEATTLNTLGRDGNV